ncbi:MAG TPA: TolC family protein, partial [Pirellulaceae bacterium]
WWRSYVSQSLRRSARRMPLTVQGLITSTLHNSYRVHVLSDTPLIRETAIVEADAEFDWGTFLESKWTDLDEPVGSSLTTGGPPRFRNDIFDVEGGFRRQNRAGGQFEAGQAFGTERSNSVFFIPKNQGTSRLTMSYTHPLLRGGGRIYNHSLILLAQVDAAIARDDFAAELQNHLTEVVKAYWALYLERGALLQRQRLFDRGKAILSDLSYRQAVDVVANQIVRAEAAVATRKSDLYRAATGVKNAEARIRALVNDPSLGQLDEVEFTPVDVPVLEPLPLDLPDAIQVAIRNRPEIQLAIKQIKASGVRLDVSKNELLPLLDVALESYVAGLQAERDIGSAFTDQFQKGAPSYSAGIRMEVPLRNRAARARFQRRALEMRQFQSQLRTTLAALQLEVEIAVREVMTSYREIEAKRLAMRASENEVDFIQERWRLLAGDDRSAGLVLEDLFAAQERLANQEFEYLTAEVQYNLAMVELQKAMGTLLQVEGIRASKQDACGIPAIQITQPHAAVPSVPTLDEPMTSVGPPAYVGP